jgi:hypothetical protein
METDVIVGHFITTMGAGSDLGAHYRKLTLTQLQRLVFLSSKSDQSPEFL